REFLVPLRIDVELEGVRLLDSAVWDLHDQNLSPEAFAARTVAELRLPARFERPIARQLHEQLRYFARAFPAWLSEGNAAPVGDSLVTLDIDVRSKWLVYRDRVEWDVSCPLNSPEAFARQTVADLQLPIELEAAIAVTMHEQIANHRQNLLRCG
ncbi:unnamed protein product, partial [Phaeothamnion confervicola]